MKLYPLSGSIVFNTLESMPSKLAVRIIDAEESGDYAAAEEAQKQIDEIRELESRLVYQHGYPYADGKTYGRLKEIATYCQSIRYHKCLSAGMSYTDAGMAFSV